MYETTPTFASENSVLSDLLAHPSLGTRRMTLAPGTVLYEPGSEATHLYFVHRGQLRTYRVRDNDGGRLLEILGPDSWCGEAALAGQAVYNEQAVAVVTSVVSEVPAQKLIELFTQHPKLATDLIKSLSAKLAAAREDAAGLVFEDCNKRLLKTLVRFSESAAATPQGQEVVLHITHHQLAQAVGVARETVSLALTQLRHKNLLRTGRNQLTFNPESLRALLSNGNGRVSTETVDEPVVSNQ